MGCETFLLADACKNGGIPAMTKSRMNDLSCTPRNGGWCKGKHVAGSAIEDRQR
jgi:hypothetical protein